MANSSNCSNELPKMFRQSRVEQRDAGANRSNNGGHCGRDRVHSPRSDPRQGHCGVPPDRRDADAAAGTGGTARALPVAGASVAVAVAADAAVAVAQGCGRDASQRVWACVGVDVAVGEGGHPVSGSLSGDPQAIAAY